MIYKFLRPLLFQLDPERAHKLALNGLAILRATKLANLIFSKIDQPCTIMGLKFSNRIGLAAGFDRNIEYVNALSELGFGFIEVGTITVQPQLGNTKPRLFRLVEHEALINRMGFANKGMEYAIQQLENLRYKGILGINIGKNKSTPNDIAIEEYLQLFNRLAKYASYIAINISSPNTEGLRELQHGHYLATLLQELKQAQFNFHKSTDKYVPLVVKISPDLNQQQLQGMAEAFVEHKIDGVIATNTTASRTEVSGHPFGAQTGGLSGKPLARLSTHCVQELRKLLPNNIALIASGGVMNDEMAKKKYAVGADLLQIYTGLIYSGPSLVKTLAQL